MMKSCIVGWYKRKITCGLEPKPIQTGATLHSLTIADGPLAGYTLHAHTFGGKNGGNLGMLHDNCNTIQQWWINLMSIMIDEYTENGQYTTMDSAYMGDIMAQIGSEIWGMNMVGMVQMNQPEWKWQRP